MVEPRFFTNHLESQKIGTDSPKHACGEPERVAGLKKSLIGFYRILYEEMVVNTVDGRNPAPLGMHKTLEIMVIYLPYQLVSRISNINRIMENLRVPNTNTSQEMRPS